MGYRYTRGGLNGVGARMGQDGGGWVGTGVKGINRMVKNRV